jgi:hypothetical protein
MIGETVAFGVVTRRLSLVLVVVLGLLMVAAAATAQVAAPLVLYPFA